MGRRRPRHWLLAALLAALGWAAGSGATAQGDEAVLVGPVADEEAAGSLQVVSFACPSIAGNFTVVAAPAGAAAPTAAADGAGCVRGDARFLVTDAAEETAEGMTGADGVVRFEGVAAGESRIVAAATGMTATVDVAADAQAVVTFFTQVNAAGTPAKTAPPDRRGDGAGAERGAAPTVEPAATPAAAQVVDLPVTGEDIAGGNGATIVLLAGLAGLVALVGAARWGRRTPS